MASSCRRSSASGRPPARHAGTPRRPRRRSPRCAPQLHLDAWGEHQPVVCQGARRLSSVTGVLSGRRRRAPRGPHARRGAGVRPRSRASRCQVPQAAEHDVAERAGGELAVRLDQGHVECGVGTPQVLAQVAPPNPPPTTTTRPAVASRRGAGLARGRGGGRQAEQLSSAWCRRRTLPLGRRTQCCEGSGSTPSRSHLAGVVALRSGLRFTLPSGRKIGRHGSDVGIVKALGNRNTPVPLPRQGETSGGDRRLQMATVSTISAPAGGSADATTAAAAPATAATP